MSCHHLLVGPSDDAHSVVLAEALRARGCTVTWLQGDRALPLLGRPSSKRQPRSVRSTVAPRRRPTPTRGSRTTSPRRSPSTSRPSTTLTPDWPGSPRRRRRCDNGHQAAPAPPRPVSRAARPPRRTSARTPLVCARWESAPDGWPSRCEPSTWSSRGGTAGWARSTSTASPKQPVAPGDLPTAARRHRGGARRRRRRRGAGFRVDRPRTLRRPEGPGRSVLARRGRRAGRSLAGPAHGARPAGTRFASSDFVVSASGRVGLPRAQSQRPVVLPPAGHRSGPARPGPRGASSHLIMIVLERPTTVPARSCAACSTMSPSTAKSAMSPRCRPLHDGPISKGGARKERRQASETGNRIDTLNGRPHWATRERIRSPQY